MIYDEHKLIHLAIPKTATSCIFDMIYKRPLQFLNEEKYKIQKFAVPLPIKGFEINSTPYKRLVTHTVTKKHPLWKYYNHGHVSCA